MVADVLKEARSEMDKAIDHLKRELMTLRTGRANAGILENVRVDYYGTPSPINHVGNVSVPEATTLMISPYDQSMLPEIEKAIQQANLGLNPTNDGKVIRISMPPLTEERRKEIVKVARKMGEDARVGVRNHRRDANDLLKKLEKDKEISEDELKDAQDEVQKLTDTSVEKVNKILKDKEDEIMHI